jgi:hypothetical protein
VLITVQLPFIYSAADQTRDVILKSFSHVGGARARGLQENS